MNNLSIDGLLKELNRIDAGGNWTRWAGTTNSITSKNFDHFCISYPYDVIDISSSRDMWISVRDKCIKIETDYGCVSEADIDETIQALTGAKIILQAMDNLNEN